VALFIAITTERHSQATALRVIEVAFEEQGFDEGKALQPFVERTHVRHGQVRFLLELGAGVDAQLLEARISEAHMSLAPSFAEEDAAGLHAPAILFEQALKQAGLVVRGSVRTPIRHLGPCLAARELRVLHWFMTARPPSISASIPLCPWGMRACLCRARLVSLRASSGAEPPATTGRSGKQGTWGIARERNPGGIRNRLLAAPRCSCPRRGLGKARLYSAPQTSWEYRSSKMYRTDP
jgi:hypothetical protein